MVLTVCGNAPCGSVEMKTCSSSGRTNRFDRQYARLASPFTRLIAPVTPSRIVNARPIDAIDRTR
jgi:hypothetical protein